MGLTIVGGSGRVKPRQIRAFASAPPDKPKNTSAKASRIDIVIEINVKKSV